MKSDAKSALFFSAHPDDVELFGLGLLLKLKAAGWCIGWVIAADGARAEGAPDPELVSRRQEEAKAAANLCGADIHFLEFPDQGIAQALSAPESIAAIYQELSPDLVLTHHPQDYHSDHRAVSRFVSDCVTAGQALLYAEPIFGIGPLPNLLIDISSEFEAKCEALACHKSQHPDKMIAAMKKWNGFRGLQCFDPDIQWGEAYCVPPAAVNLSDAAATLPTGSVAKRLR